MFSKVPDAVCVWLICPFPFQNKFQLSEKKSIGQHKSISISLSIHILMSKKIIPDMERVGEDDKVRSMLSCSLAVVIRRSRVRESSAAARC
jgi:hypothetical protein